MFHKVSVSGSGRSGHQVGSGPGSKGLTQFDSRSLTYLQCIQKVWMVGSWFFRATPYRRHPCLFLDRTTWEMQLERPRKLRHRPASFLWIVRSKYNTSGSSGQRLWTEPLLILSVYYMWSLLQCGLLDKRWRLWRKLSTRNSTKESIIHLHLAHGE